MGKLTKGILADAMLNEIFWDLIQKCHTCKQYQKEYDDAMQNHFMSELPSILVKDWMKHLETKGHKK